MTCLQQAHNWVAKSDRNKMTFWLTILFDDDATGDEGGNYGDFRPEVAKVELQNWIERNSRFCDKARQLLVEYEDGLAARGLPPGNLPRISPLAWNWMPEGSITVRADDLKESTKITPVWKEDEPDKFEQDRLYSRVSREVDTWWLKVRDPNYDKWIVRMPTVEFAQVRADNCKANLVSRYSRPYRSEDHEDSAPPTEGTHPPEFLKEDAKKDVGAYPQEYNDDMIEEEDGDDDDSYGEGPMSGLLTEVPNVLDPKQIEALHMIIKSCILDNTGLALSRAGENLQKTRCRMLLALECGRSLLREILVFLAVWEKNEQTLIFQLTTQIIEAIHHSALIPYAWQSLRIPKDIISPAQTVLLRLVNAMFRARNGDPPPIESKEHSRDIKLLHFLFIQFRSRLVPECLALMHLQAQVRNELCDPADFPVDSWDMDRAKEGLQQFLELFATVIEHLETRAHLIEWEVTYELLAILKGLEGGVPKKSMVEPPSRSSQRPSVNSSTDAQADDDDLDHGYDSGDPPPPPPPPLQEPAHRYPWAGIKGQILHLLAGLLQPPPHRSSPGNPQVQAQIVRYNGIVALLNCCVYDDHNKFARERVQVCLKWLMDGSETANNFLRELVAMSPPPNHRPEASNEGQPSDPGPVQSLRIDGIAGEVKVRVKASSTPPLQAGESRSGPALPPLASSTAILGDDVRNTTNTLAPIHPTAGPSTTSQSTRDRSEELLRDIFELADEAARLAMGRRPDADETEEEDFM